MPISVTCSKAECGKTLKVKDELAGKRVKCPACQAVLTIPEPSAPAEPPAADEPARAGILSQSELLVRRKGGFHFGFKGGARVILEILDPQNQQVLGVVRKEKDAFDWKQLVGLATKPIRLDVREGGESGPNQLTLLIKRTLLSQVLGKVTGRQIDVTLLDASEQPLGTFRYRPGVLNASLTLLDRQDRPAGEARWNSGKELGLVLLDSDDVRRGSVLEQNRAQMAETMKKVESGEKVGVQVNVQSGHSGHIARVDDAFRGDLETHQRLLALAVIVEATGIGKAETGATTAGQRNARKFVSRGKAKARARSRGPSTRRRR